MLDHGHSNPFRYTVSRIWEEVELVVERENRKLVNLAVIIQKATGTTGMTASKETVKDFTDFIKKLIGEA